MEYFSNALENWKGAFDKNDPQSKVLHRHWDRWIETAGKKRFVNMEDDE